jgi:DNA-binding transcriptional MocR family regulator
MYDLTGVAPPWPTELQRGWADAVREAAASERAWHSPRGRGEPLLVEMLADLLGVRTDEVTVVTGVRAAAVVLGRCRRVAFVERPTFAEIPRILATGGADVRLTTWPELADALDQDPCQSLAWITSPARNPDGASLDPVLTGRLAEASDRGAIVVHNEINRWYGDPPAARIALPAVRVGSLSKLAGGGARVGWVVHAPAEADPALRQIAPPTQWQRAWAALLQRVSWSVLIEALTGPVVRAREAFLAALDEPVRRLLNRAGPTTLLPLGTMAEEEAWSLLAARGLRTGRGRDFACPCPSLRLAFTGLDPAGATTAGQILRAACADHPDLTEVRPRAGAGTCDQRNTVPSAASQGRTHGVEHWSA